jgi:hypothetical protein
MKDTETPKYIIFNSIGSLEKDLIGTAVVHSIKQQYKNHSIIVVSNNPDVWLHNPSVYRVYRVGNLPYFYDDYVKDRESVIFWQDPYATDDYLQRRKHIIEIWCELCGVQYRKTKPQLFFTQREQEVTKKMLGLDKPSRPIFVIQTHTENAPEIPYFWTRDIPTKIAREVVSEMMARGYYVLHLRFGKEAVLPGTESLNLSIRQMFCAINFADARLLINSFAPHVSAALGKRSVVFWVAQNPVIAGYPINRNLVPDSDSKLGQYVSEFNENFASDEDRMQAPLAVEDYYSSSEIVNLLTL